MTGDAVGRVLEALERHEGRPRQSGEGWTFFCPVHGDGKSPAGSLRQGTEGALVRCNAGCDTEAVLSVLGLTMAALFDTTGNGSGSEDRWTKGATYTYTHDGRPVARKTRWIKPDGTRTQSWQRYERGKWESGLNGSDPGLYRADEMSHVVPGGDVVVTEGESDCEAVRAAGLVAVSPPHGAGPGKWRPEYTTALAATGCRVVLCRDRDATGMTYASEVYGHLVVAGCEVALVEPVVGKDVRDHLEAGMSLDELAIVTQSAPPAPVVVRSNGHHPPPPPDGVPRLGMAVIEDHLLGQLAIVVAEATGVSLSAPWASICALVGTWIGRNPVVYAAGEHHCHDYAALVGRSGTGKGYSWWAVRELLAPAIGGWVNHRVIGGINSSEAMIDHLAEAEEEGMPPDPRLLILEPEFSRLMAVSSRGGTTISQALRELWDSPPVQTTSARVKKASAKEPHVGLVGHVTPADLAGLVSDADLRNGLSGRILWCWVTDDRFQPMGPDHGWEYGHNHLLSALTRVGAEARQQVGVVTFSPEALDLWNSDSPRLHAAAKARPDPIDALLTRGPSHVVRTAMLLAITDDRHPAPRRVIHAEHLQMALSWWDSFQAPSTLYVWGQDGVVSGTREDQAERQADTPDRTRAQRRAERVLAACQKAGPNGLDSEGQRRALGNRVSASELHDIRTDLARRGLVEVHERSTQAHGQKAIVIIAK